MKKSNMLSVLVTIVMFFTLSCTTGQVQFDQESQVTIAKITGRRAGYQLEVRYPEISHEVLVLSKAILSVEKPDLIRITINRIVVILAGEVDDPLLVADLQDIISLIKIETGIEIPDEKMQIIQAVTTGLISGIGIAQQQQIKQD